MRVCMVVYAFYESDTRVLQYANALAERGDVVDVFALRREGSPAREVLNGVNVYRIQTRRVNERGKFAYLRRILRFFFLSFFCLTRRHMAKSYDAVHVHSVPDFLVFAALIPKLSGSRIILDIHDILPEFYASKFGVKPSSLLFRSLLWVENFPAASQIRSSLPITFGMRGWSSEQFRRRNAHLSLIIPTQRCSG